MSFTSTVCVCVRFPTRKGAWMHHECSSLYHLLGTFHRVHREAPGVQQVSLETLQDDPRGR